DPGRATGLVLTQLVARDLAREHLVGEIANDALREQRQRRERRRVKARRVETVLAEEALVVRRGAARVAQDALEPRALPGKQRRLREPLGALELTQDAEPAAAVLHVPQRVEHVVRQRTHQPHTGLTLCVAARPPAFRRAGSVRTPPLTPS